MEKSDKKTMKAFVIEDFTKKPVVKELPIPVPKKGEVLIRVESSPINPSDMYFVEGSYNKKVELPVIPGFEGSGVVVASGGGVFPWWIMGKRVAFCHQNGSWCQYAVLPANNCIVLDNNVPFNEGSCSFVNPLTVLGRFDFLLVGLFSIIEEKKVKTVIQTASCSQLGRMFLRYCNSKGITVVNIVRRQEQVEILKKEENADCVLNSSDPDFEQRLEGIAQALNITLAFDAIGGNFLETLLKNLPYKSVVYVYGSLSGEEGNFNIHTLIQGNKSINNFYLANYLLGMSLVSLVAMTYKAKKLMANQLKTKVVKEIALENICEGIEYYKKNMTSGKVIVKPWKEGTN